MTSIIVASTLDGGIGLAGDMLYHVSADLRRFKALTTGHTVVMGRKTFESLPKGALPQRRNIVISRNPDYTAAGIEVAGSLEQALGMAAGDSEVFVIGGESIYRQAMTMADRLYLTLFDIVRPDADTRFPLPELDTAGIEWHCDERSSLRYSFIDIDLKSQASGLNTQPSNLQPPASSPNNT